MPFVILYFCNLVRVFLCFVCVLFVFLNQIQTASVLFISRPCFISTRLAGTTWAPGTAIGCNRSIVIVA